MYEMIYVLVSALLLISNVYSDSPIIRQTSNGPVEGIEETSSLGQKYYAFRGIPYAEPPITNQEVDRRFKVPEPLKRNWTENLKVYNFSNCCIPSTDFFQTKTKKSEDCLYLNIYIPVGGAERKTVLIWIHGGAFTEGEGTDLLYGPDFLLSEDNIVITIQYRVGIFGFLNLGFGDYTGNMGLKDQQLALKWIYDNIEHFLGKKNEILAFGESAGGCSVSFQILNEESRKYFNRAAMLSGSSMNFYALSEVNHLDRMRGYANIQDKKELIQYLKTTDSDTLAKCHNKNNFGNTFISPWVPTIEHPNAKNAFITKPPEDIYNSDKAPVMDTLFTFTSQEYITFDNDLIKRTEPLIKGDSDTANLMLPFHGFDANTYPNEYKDAIDKLRKAYLPDTSDVEAVKRGNIALLSDLNFAHAVLKNAILQTKANNNGNDSTKHRNTFLSRFSVNSDLNLFKVSWNLEYDGAAHAEDICYFFHCHSLDMFKLYDNHLTHKQNGSNVVYDTIKKMVKIFTNFARTGNPSIEGDTSFRSCTSPEEIYCQEISNNMTTNVIDDIREQLNYDTWHGIEESVKKLRVMPNSN